MLSYSFGTKQEQWLSYTSTSVILFLRHQTGTVVILYIEQCYPIPSAPNRRGGYPILSAPDQYTSYSLVIKDREVSSTFLHMKQTEPDLKVSLSYSLDLKLYYARTYIPYTGPWYYAGVVVLYSRCFFSSFPEMTYQSPTKADHNGTAPSDFFVLSERPTC